MRKHTGLDLATAVRMATLTPATITGMQDDIGSLDAGKRADFVFLDPQLEVLRVFHGGEEVRLDAGRTTGRDRQGPI